MDGCGDAEQLADKESGQPDEGSGAASSDVDEYVLRDGFCAKTAKVPHPNNYDNSIDYRQLYEKRKDKPTEQIEK